MPDREFRCFGPPGCGKTRWVSEQVLKALDKYRPEEIVCCSFTRAAAEELAGRGTGLPDRNIGTIHSLCYRALDRPTILETDNELLAEWNAEYPDWEVDGKTNIDDTQGKACNRLQVYNRDRGMLRADTFAPYFAAAWEAFKQEHDCMDFTDLLLYAPPTTGARMLVVDEAQDLTPLQGRVVRMWGQNTDIFLMAGDDDQCVYHFLGADPDVFLSTLPDDRKLHLRHSYRMSRAVYDCAESWIHKIEGNREEKHYEPAREGGSVEQPTMSFADTDEVIEEVAERASKGQTVMLLASCSYMLHGLLERLRQEGLPFHNRYRRNRGDWNPLRATARKLAAFLECCECAQGEKQWIVDPDAWLPWLKMLQADCFLTTKKLALIMPVAADEAWLEGVASDDLLRALLETDVKWLVEHMTTAAAKASQYPLRVYEQGGADALTKAPRIVIGTIHSVKGGEADAVYLSPDLSYEACQYRRQTRHVAEDALRRLFYVGMTRAKHDLVLCQAASMGRRIQWQ